MTKLYFTINELNPHNYPLTEEIENNLNILIIRLSKLRELWGKPMSVNSGLRSQEDQARINPSAPKSKHLIGAAVDLADRNGEMKAWLKANPKILIECDLYCEAYSYTPTWLHCQIISPRSGLRVFKP